MTNDINTSSHRARKTSLIAGGFAAFALTACTTEHDIACPDTETSSYIGIDLSDTRSSEQLKAAQLNDIRPEAERTALCGGHLQTTAFSSSTGATASLFEGALEAEGATMPARRRRLDETVAPAMEEIEARLATIDSELPGDGTDILGQLELMAEYFGQRPGTAHRGLLLTDGIQTSGSVVLNDGEFTEAVAADLAARVSVPDLTGAEVTIAGVGKVAGDPPPSSYVSALKTFWRIVCERTGASRCLAVTDLATNQGEG